VGKEPVQSIIQSAKNLKREFAEIDRLFADSNKDTRRLMFYAESSIYFRYYEDYIEYILQNSDLDVCYITSTADDEIFQHSNPRIKPFFIRNLLVGALQRFDGKVLVMTAPDLDTGAIKRAPHPVHHVYAFHGISSTHQYYRPAAFYNYDSILCIADYQVNEIRKTEQLYNLKPKNLVVTGYPLLERIYRQHQEYRKTHQPTAGQRPICLIAPTWAMDFRGSSILDSCIEELITAMSVTQFDVWVRPHPEFMKSRKK
jgi:YidC/Oxa1 family membrane protein insertase